MMSMALIIVLAVVLACGAVGLAGLVIGALWYFQRSDRSRER